MGKVWGHLLLLAGAAGLVMFVNLGGPRLWDRDEPRNAACAREMLERGDWVVPTFNGELRVLKPIMKYWLMMSAYKIFGVNEFAARFWSAVFALFTVWATYAIGRCLLDPRAALWSALILATCVLFVATGHLAKADAPLTFFSTLALLIFVYGAFKKNVGEEAGSPEGVEKNEPFQNEKAWSFPQSWWMGALIYVSLGLAVLAKGLPGLMPAAVIGMFLLIVRLPKSETGNGWKRLVGLLRPFSPGHFLRTFWLMRPITGAVVVLAVAGPWYFLVGIRTDGEFLRAFFLEHHLGRAMTPMENHRGPFLLYYLGTISVGFFPWSVFVPAALVWLVAQLRQNHPWRFAYLLAACWVGVYVVIFSLAKTKLPNYIAPCFPGLALLMGAFIHQLASGVLFSSEGTGAAPKRFLQTRFWIGFGLLMLGITGVGVAVTIVIAARIFFPGKELLGLIGLILVLGSCASYFFMKRGLAMRASLALVVTALAFCATSFGIGLAQVGRTLEHRAICAAIYARTSDPRIAYFGGIEPSWVFYARRNIRPVLLTDELPDQSYAWKVKPIPAAEFFKQGDDRFIITTDHEWKWLQTTLPADAQVLVETPRFLRKGRWLLIGHGLRATHAQP